MAKQGSMEDLARFWHGHSRRYFAPRTFVKCEKWFLLMHNAWVGNFWFRADARLPGTLGSAVNEKRTDGKSDGAALD
jgi:hypothetical protein